MEGAGMGSKKNNVRLLCVYLGGMLFFSPSVLAATAPDILGQLRLSPAYGRNGGAESFSGRLKPEVAYGFSRQTASLAAKAEQPQEPGDTLEEKPALPVDKTMAGKSTLPLTLRGAVKLALSGNRQIQVASYNPSIASEEINSVQSIYDVTLFEETNITRIDRPNQSLLDNGTLERGEFLEHRWDSRAGVKKALPTGGVVSLFADVDHVNSSSELLLPNPQYTSRLTAQVRQALLREYGDSSNQAAIAKARQGLVMTEAEYRKTVVDTVKEVAGAYWRFVFYRQQLVINENALLQGEEILKKEQARNQQGLASKLDVDRAMSTVQERKRAEVTARSLYLVAMTQLKLLLGILPGSELFDTVIEPEESVAAQTSFSTLEAMVVHAQQARPEMVIARKKVEVAEIQKIMSENRKLPKLDAKASYTLNSLGSGFNTAVDGTYFSDDASWAIGFEFEYPWGGRKADAEYRKAVLQHEQAQTALLKSSEQIAYEINAALHEVVQAEEEVAAAKEAHDARSRVLAREKVRFELAKTGNRGLLDAQDDYYEARRNYMRAALNLNIALLQLRWATGGLPEEFDLRMDE